MAKFLLTQASDHTRKDEIEINSLEELLDFIKEHGRIIIEQMDSTYDGQQELMIYDDYVE
ncbi:hypothetical protein [Enterobacter cloacae]|uniref:hypothetical protein n=1 Tax=Enterobacter cloacae TaxID=550 RepID=UPI0021D05B71|nr:hypothetical protein [Enterobacter cloacae]MCU6204632.1 hypothetical protein [Enterobacter cloacae]